MSRQANKHVLMSPNDRPDASCDHWQESRAQYVHCPHLCHVSQWRQSKVKLLPLATGSRIHPYHVVTVFDPNSNLRQIQIQTKHNEFSFTQTDVLLIATFWLVGLCQVGACTKGVHAWQRPTGRNVATNRRSVCVHENSLCWFEFEFVSDLNLD